MSEHLRDAAKIRVWKDREVGISEVGVEGCRLGVLIERAEKVVKEVGGRLVFTVPPDYGAPSDLPTHLRGLQTICSCIHGSFAREFQRAIALQINDAVVGVQEEHVEQWIERNRRDARIFTFCLIGAFLIGLGGGILWGVL